MYDVIIKALTDFGIYGLFVLIYTLIGTYQNINVFGHTFDWKRYVNGLVKYLALGGALVATVVGSFILLDQAAKQGVDIVNAQAVAPRVIFGVVLLASAGMLAKIIAKLTTTFGLTDEQLKALQTKSVNTDADKPLVVNVADLPQPSEDYAKQKLAAEQDPNTGLGALYSVPIDNYDVFRAAVLGHGYDVDGWYGFQCWDGAALLWQQLGKSLYTGNGNAIGCWDLKRDANTYGLFDLVTDVNSLRRGDVVVMRPNHIGFFDGYDGGYMLILGQNQGGSPTNAAGGSGFNVVRISKSAFAGAFRYHGWNVATPAPAPQPVTPTKPVDDEVVAAVRRGDYGNGADRKVRLTQAGYDANAVQAAVNAAIANQPAPAPQPDAPASAIQYTYRSGDTFGQVILNLGLNTEHGLWGADGDVNYYNAQLHAQGIYGNIPVGRTITLVRRGA